MKIPLIKTTFVDDLKTKEALSRFLLSSDRLSMGPKTLEWETRFASWHNRKYAVFVNSGSSANLLLIQSLLCIGLLDKGAKVGFTSVTWSTNVMPLIQLGLTPLPLDVSLKTLNTPLEEIQKLHSQHPDLKCIFLTNVLGFCDNISDISSYCHQNSILLIEDNCESLGSIFCSTLLGNFGFASTVSTFVGHHLSTIEGGFVLTDDYDMYLTLLSSRAHGWGRSWPLDVQEEYRIKYNVTQFSSLYTFYNIGMNLRPTELSSVLGLLQIDYLANSVQLRDSTFTFFSTLIKQLNFTCPYNCLLTRISAFALPIVFDTSKQRDFAVTFFREKSIESRPLVSGNILRQPFAKNYFIDTDYDLPNADRIHDCALYIACRPDFTDNEVSFVSQVLSDLSHSLILT